MSSDFRAIAARHLYHLLGDERPRQSRVQRVPSLVEGVRLQSRKREVGEELFFGVLDDRLDGPGGEGPLAQTLQILHLADVHEYGDDLVAVLLLHVGDQGGRIQTAGIRENAFLLAHEPLSSEFCQVLADCLRRLQVFADHYDGVVTGHTS